MIDKLIMLYCVCDDVLRACHVKADKQAKMDETEVLFVALAGAMLFGGSYRRARWFLKGHGYIPNMLSESRLNRRLHSFDTDLLYLIFHLISRIFTARNSSNEYIVDSFPVEVCHNIRIFRCHVFKGESFRGYCASKQSYFYGLKVHLVTTCAGEPVDFSLSPGGASDIVSLRKMPLAIPAGSLLYADAAYQDQLYEDLLAEEGISLCAQRRGNQKRQWSPSMRYVQGVKRRRIETSISRIKQLMSARIEAVTAKGFSLKICFFLLASAISCI